MVHEGKTDTPKIETFVAGAIDELVFLRLCELHLEAFPKQGRTLDSVLERKRPMWMRDRYPPGKEAKRCVVRDAADPSRFVANAGTLVRRVEADGASGGGEFEVLGLLDVATSPRVRGRGLGEHIVRAAWERVDAGVFAFSLFQTGSATGFYERLGARVIDNVFRDSTNKTEPDANPFTDAHVMVYAPRGGWPTGVIDLRGGGY